MAMIATPQLTEVPFEKLEIIRTLWWELVENNAETSTYFAPFFRSFTFETRLEMLGDKMKKGMCMRTLAVMDEEGEPQGFCTVTYHPEAKDGELEMLYMRPNQRGKGTGSRLMQAAMDIFEENGIVSPSINVACGNEAAMGFYAKFGFHPFISQLLLDRNNKTGERG